MRGVRLSRVLCILIVGGLSGCDGFPLFQAFTLAGCSDVLSVELLGQLPEEFTLRAEAPGEEPQIRECSSANQCGSTVFFEDFTPEQVKLVFQTAAGSTEMTVSPRYSAFRPNVKDCPPKCRQGVVEFPIP